MKTMQMQLVLEGEATGHPDKARDEFIAARLSEGPTGEDRLMETICGRENMLEALKRVEGNKGAPGVDGMKTAQLRGYLLKHWDKIKGGLLNGTHQPMPVRRSEIPKENGGVRLLGIPTVLDRLIQQAVAQALSPLWDYTFSEHSYTYGRPRRRSGSKARSAALSPADSSWWSTRRKAQSAGRGIASTLVSVSRASWGRRAPASMRKAFCGSAGARTDGPRQGSESGGGHRRTEQPVAGLGRILPPRPLRNAGRNARPLDKATPPGVCLDTVETAEDAGQQPHGARHRQKMGGGGRQHPQGRLAAQQERNGMRGTA